MTKPADAGPNYTSAEYAQQYQRGRTIRNEGSQAATGNDARHGADQGGPSCPGDSCCG